jgi:predicted LPLAT superfamily acyltransferase
VELEQRISRLEMKLQRACEELDLTRQRLTALQAKLDHYAARFGHI